MAMYTNLHYHHQYEREQLFEKPLTPSDVGKLNRLVIPKQHAERYFPLGGGGGGCGDAGEKGLLLTFEDEAGKPWRFRYSYWTSSQSYVLTKGWSRYVKEKRLDAGDVVRFERVRGGLGVGDRLFIGSRRRGESAPAPTPPPPVRAPPPAVNGGEQPWSPMCYSTSGSSYPTSPASSYAYHSDVPHAAYAIIFSMDDRRRDDDDGEQEQRCGAVEEAPAVRREPRLRAGAGAEDADGNVRIHAPAEPLLRGSLGGAKLLVSSPYCKHHQVQFSWSHRIRNQASSSSFPN
ncbi:hypothetical protein PR202_gb00485 [Eleusine coracana subsp. coracana]|uniref:TF-B3 domain-containing protein n=1 Tax=Eleusine coracana subsp. coracana TaxID=191504 RepID=A0AAV5DU04_ELECO|nr:hypothetical protein PR202_gb00485 [Eleusine coracana subsp. coracana]